MRFYYGKYKGKEISDAPTEYLKWIHNKLKDGGDEKLRNQVHSVIVRRETLPPPTEEEKLYHQFIRRLGIVRKSALELGLVKTHKLLCEVSVEAPSEHQSAWLREDK